jgi:hypothetical protein
MAVDEQRRNALYRAAADVLGEDHAATMFEMLPPPSSELATEGSVVSLGASVDQRFAQIDHRFEQIDRRFDQIDHRFDQVDQQFDTLRHELTSAFRGELVAAVSSQARLLVVAVIGTVVGVGGLAIAFAQLL